MILALEILAYEVVLRSEGSKLPLSYWKLLEVIAKVENCIGKTGNIPNGLGNDIKSGENFP